MIPQPKSGRSMDNTTARRLFRDQKLETMKWRHHGLGMLQAEIDEKVRIHIWHPMLRADEMFGLRSIHDHRFTLVSHVIHGAIIDVPHQVDIGHPGAVHSGSNVWAIPHAKIQSDHAQQAGEGNIFLGRAAITVGRKRKHSAGDSYEISRRAWHASEHDDTKRPSGYARGVVGVAATVVERFDFDDEPARVLGHGRSGIIHNTAAQLVEHVLDELRKVIRAEEQ